MKKSELKKAFKEFSKDYVGELKTKLGKNYYNDILWNSRDFLLPKDITNKKLVVGLSNQ